jgi:hypothetical protein
MPGAKPVHLHPYPLPCVHLQTFKHVLGDLIEIGFQIPTKESEWASTTFIIPKRMIVYAGLVIYAS